MKRWVLTLFLWMSPTLLVAATPLDLSNRDALEWAVNDDPISLLPRAKEEFATADLEKNPKHWVRALWLYAKLVREWQEIPDVQALMEEGIRIADREQMPEELLAFKGFLPAILEEMAQDTRHAIDSKAVIQKYEELVAEARRMEVKRAEADALVSFAFYLYDVGETTRSLQVLLDASKVLAEDPNATELNRMDMKNFLALAYSYQNEMTRSKALYLEIDDFCSRSKPRYFCLTNDYNLGKLLVDMKDASDWAKAEDYLRKSLQTASEIGDKRSMGIARSGLTVLYIDMKQFDKAVQHARVAIKLFREIQNIVWLADTYKKSAKALIGAKRYNEALNAIAEARRLFPQDYRRDFNDLEELSYQTYRGLGQTDKALEHLEKHDAEFKKMAIEREKSDYSKLMVGMGLQIEEEKNKVLTMDIQLKNQKLAETERLRVLMLVMLCLAALVIVSMGIAVAHSREITRSRIKMHRILSNIKEGILTVNKQLEVESEYSRYLTILWDTQDKLTGKAALPLLLDKTNLKSEDRSMVQEILNAALGGDELQWSLNEQHLPSELIYPGPKAPRIVAVHWQPLFDRNQLIQGTLIGLSDVTERRKLEAEIAFERERSDRRGRLIQELAQAEQDRVDALLTQIKDLEPQLSQLEQLDVRRPLLRELHTIKGIARVLGLKELSADVHELEDSLQKNTDSSTIQSRCERFSETAQEYLRIVQDIFRRRAGSSNQYRNLAAVVQSLLPGITEQMHEAGLSLRSLEIIDRVMDWSPQHLKMIEQILVHALSNSADHGFIFPKKRGMPGREPGFQIEARRHAQHLELAVRDNGAGLDLKRLQELAQKMNFVPAEGRSIADVVFLDGSTTAEQVSRTSGRGVGMAAIRSLCQEAGGEVHMEPNPAGSGAQLIVTLPLEQLKASA